MTQTARAVARGGDPAADCAPAALPLPGRQALAARTSTWYAALPARRREVAQDTGLALGLAALNLLSLLPYQAQLHPAWVAFVLVAAQCLPLAVRRLLPVPALLVSGALRDLYDGLSFSFAPLPLAPAIAFATVADRSRWWIRWITVACTVGGIAYSQTLPGHNEPYDAIVQACIFGAAWVLGTVSRHRRAALAEAASRAARAEASLDLAAADAAAAERGRIARELHDVVAHHVSLIAVQAEAVGALLPARPADAATSADAIAATARQAMTELRRLLGVLRFKAADQELSPERTRLTPAPSLSRLDDLLASVRSSGLPVTVAIEGRAGPPLPPGVDLTAYRIIQEALTNARRHAPGSAASVTVTYEQAALAITVTNTTPAAGIPAATSAGPDDPSAGGYGLAGIAERVASCGGSLALGPAADLGFTVTARLPLK